MGRKLGTVSGVRGYIHGTCTVRNPFPVDLRGNPFIDCMHCRFFRQASRRCGLSGEIPAFPEKYIGAECPLDIEEDVVDEFDE